MSKNYKLQLKNTSGEVLGESNLVLNEGDIVLMTYDTEKFTTQNAHSIYNSFVEGLEEDVKVMGIPNGITLQVLSK